MSIRLLTANQSYQILASEKDSSGNAFAVTFKGEDSGLTVTPSSDSDDNQVVSVDFSQKNSSESDYFLQWLLAGSSGSWALTPRNTLFYASPTKSGKNVQAEERGEAFHWDVTADDGNPTEFVVSLVVTDDNTH